MFEEDTLHSLDGPGGGPADPIPCLSILYHPDLSRIGERALLGPLAAGQTMALSRSELDFAPPGQSHGAPLRDPYVSRRPIVLTADGDAVTLARADAGSVAVDGARLDGDRRLAAAELARGVVLELSKRVVLLLHLVVPGPPVPALSLVGGSNAIDEVRRSVLRVADLDVPVLIRGETGAGKERVALAVHVASRRNLEPFVAVNMAAVSPTTAVSELFGHARGAFTGATAAHLGLFERAHGGTLFLDEIGETPDHIQTMLLRVLETGEVLPVGGQEPRHVDVRVVAATDADLERASEQGRFRSALLHRLVGYEIAVPPLRARRDDVPRLAVAFLREELAAIGEQARLRPPAPTEARLWFPPSLMARLVRHRWPGNVRQLRNVIRQLVISSRGADSVRADERVERLLQETTSDGAGSPPPAEPGAVGGAPAASAAAPAGTSAPSGRRRRASEVTDEELLATLRAHAWALLPTATALGIPRSTLYDLIDRSPSIRKAKDVTEQELASCQRELAGDLTAMAARLQVSRRGLQLRLRELGLG